MSTYSRNPSACRARCSLVAPACLAATTIAPTGKVDRALLRKKTLTRGAEAHEMVSPRNAEEMLLAGIWSEVLGVKEVGVFDNFFVLGGDSIRSVQVLGRAREQGLTFTLQQLFQQQTIAALVANVPDLHTAGSSSLAVAPFGLLQPAD